MITTKCNRNCSYCCNNKPGVLDSAIQVNELGFVKDYDAICLTGGEPMLYPDRLRYVIETIRSVNPKAKIFLYTALITKRMWEMVDILDGINYTLHEDFAWKELMQLHLMQTIISSLPSDTIANKSFRLLIAPEIKSVIPIVPNLWQRIESKPWNDVCEILPNETFFNYEFNDGRMFDKS